MYDRCVGDTLNERFSQFTSMKSVTPFDPSFIGPFARGRSLLSAVVYSFDSQRIVETCLFDGGPIYESWRWKAQVLRTMTDLESSTTAHANLHTARVNLAVFGWSASKRNQHSRPQCRSAGECSGFQTTSVLDGEERVLQDVYPSEDACGGSVGLGSIHGQTRRKTQIC